jgi:hypothetical protein
MKLLRTLCFAVTMAATASTVPAQAPPKPTGPPPVQAFFDEGSVQDLRTSPDGRWIAAQVVPAEGGNTRLVLMDLQGKEPPMVLAAFSRANVRGVRWVNDDMLLVGVITDAYRTPQYRNGALVAVRRDGRGMRLLVKSIRLGLPAAWQPAAGAQPCLLVARRTGHRRNRRRRDPGRLGWRIHAAADSQRPHRRSTLATQGGARQRDQLPVRSARPCSPGNHTQTEHHRLPLAGSGHPEVEADCPVRGSARSLLAHVRRRRRPALRSGSSQRRKRSRTAAL